MSVLYPIKRRLRSYAKVGTLFITICIWISFFLAAVLGIVVMLSYAP